MLGREVVESEPLPRLWALAHAVDEADEFLLALGCGADDDQQALGLVFEPGLHVDAVDPEVDVSLPPTLSKSLATASSRFSGLASMPLTASEVKRPREM